MNTISEREQAIRTLIVMLRSPILIAQRAERKEALALSQRHGLTVADLIEYLDTARRARLA